MSSLLFSTIILLITLALAAPLPLPTPQNPHLDNAKNVLLGFKDKINDPHGFTDNWTDGSSSTSKKTTSSTTEDLDTIKPEDIDYPPRIPIKTTPTIWSDWWDNLYSLPQGVSGADLINSRPEWWWLTRRPQMAQELCDGGWIPGCK